MEEKVSVLDGANFYKSWDEKWIAVPKRHHNVYMSDDGVVFHEMSGTLLKFRDPRHSDRSTQLDCDGDTIVVNCGSLNYAPIYQREEWVSHECKIVPLPYTRKMIYVGELVGIKPLAFCVTDSVYRPTDDSVLVYIGENLESLKKVEVPDLDVDDENHPSFTVEMDGHARLFVGGISSTWEGLNVSGRNISAYTFKEFLEEGTIEVSEK